MDRIVDVGKCGSRIRLETGRLSIKDEEGNELRVAVKDIDVLVLSEPGLSVSAGVLAELAEKGATTVICSRSHRPVGLVHPLVAHSLQSGYLRGQVAARELVKGRLWQQIVRAKITAQADCLLACRNATTVGASFRALAAEVMRGDKTNVEGHVALRYWNALSLMERRERDGGGVNGLLNYGYAVLLGATTRAVCAAGLHPGLGIHHCSSGNAYCLASDLMEPFRPMVDRLVFHWCMDHRDEQEVTAASRRFLLSGILASRWQVGAQRKSLFDALQGFVISVRSCLLEVADTCVIPTFVHPGEDDVVACAV